MLQHNGITCKQTQQRIKYNATQQEIVTVSPDISWLVVHMYWLLGGGGGGGNFCQSKFFYSTMQVPDIPWFGVHMYYVLVVGSQLP